MVSFVQAPFDLITMAVVTKSSFQKDIAASEIVRVLFDRIREGNWVVCFIADLLDSASLIPFK